MNITINYLCSKYQSPQGINPLKLNTEFDTYSNKNNFEDFVVLTIPLDKSSEILVLKIDTNEENVVQFKYNLLRDYIKEMLKYNYDCLKNLHLYVEKNNFSLQFKDLDDFKSKVSSLTQKDLDRIFLLFPDLFPKNFIFLFLKKDNQLEVLNNTMHTDLISHNKSLETLSLLKFNFIIEDINVSNSFNKYSN